MWHDVNEYQLSLQQHLSDRDGLLNRIDRASQQLLLLKVRRKHTATARPVLLRSCLLGSVLPSRTPSGNASHRVKRPRTLPAAPRPPCAMPSVGRLMLDRELLQRRLSHRTTLCSGARAPNNLYHTSQKTLALQFAWPSVLCCVPDDRAPFTAPAVPLLPRCCPAAVDTVHECVERHLPNLA